MSTLLLISATSLLAVSPADSADRAAVVAIQADNVLYDRIARVVDWSLALDMTVLDAEELQRRLTGIAQPQTVDVEEFKKKLANADEREAHYNVAAANELRRQIVTAYDNSPLPSPELRVLAAQALHAIAAANLYDGKKDEANEAARSALRRFPSVPLDTRRHPPVVETLFKRVASELKRIPTTEVTFTISRPADIFADGVQVAQMARKASRKLPQGTYSIYATDVDGTSMSHVVVVGSKASAVEIDLDLESSLSWQPFPTLRCAPSCDVALQRLAVRVSATTGVGLRLDNSTPRSGEALVVPAAEGQVAQTRRLSALADMQPSLPYAGSDWQVAPRNQFSPWSLVPFGVGQFAQRRYIAGSTYAGIQAGLAVWHVIALVRYSDHANSADDAEENARLQRNVSGSLLIAAMIANVAEALVVDAITK